MELTVFPKINAALNFFSIILLTGGYLAIRQKNEKTHKFFMLCAFFCSILFLSSYLWYHGHVETETRYMVANFSRYIYYAILISHVILAAILPFAVLTVLVFALRKNFVLHKKIARIVFPLWMYVSITGIAVFIFLYVVQ